jgi:hypothetical protein
MSSPIRWRSKLAATSNAHRVLLYELLAAGVFLDNISRRFTKRSTRFGKRSSEAAVRQPDLSGRYRDHRGEGPRERQDSPYTSAAELGADITHYLNDEPIIAQPPTASYQLKKFARRNRALVVGLAGIFVVLLLASL